MNMRFKFLILVLLIHTNIFSQTKLDFSLSIAPIVSGHILSAKSDTIPISAISSKNYIAKSNKIAKSYLGYKIVAEIFLHISQNLRIYSGVSFLNYKVEQVDMFPIASYIINNESYSGGYEISKRIESYKSILIPAGISLNLISRNKMNFAMIGEINIGCASIPKYTIYADQYKINLQYTHHLSIISACGFGINGSYKLTEHLWVFCKPNVNLSITPNFNLYSAINYRSYYWGADFGINWDIN